MEQYLAGLNAPEREDRLAALKRIRSALDAGNIEKPGASRSDDVNNHIHTTYSFSPYSPTKAVYMSYMAGLNTCGIVDHDSIDGAVEFIEAGCILEIATTIGFEMRLNFEKTPFAQRRLNNPDQPGNAYVTVHGIAHNQISKVQEFLAPVNRARGQRNRGMVAKINAIFAPQGCTIDYDQDVLPISMAYDGGSVTERHLLYALSLKLIERFGRGQALLDILCNEIGLSFSDKIKTLLLETDSAYYSYDLLGALKAELVSKIYIPAIEECYEPDEYIEFCREIGALSCAAYLGDIGDSVTGDKKTQTFEDSYLDELFAYYAQLGFSGASYMPSRNTLAQLKRVQALCEKFGFIQISGEDINQPRQRFVCEAARSPEFSGLVDATWALIGNETAVSKDINDSLIGEKAEILYPDLHDRILAYKALGLQSH